MRPLVRTRVIHVASQTAEVAASGVSVRLPSASSRSRRAGWWMSSCAYVVLACCLLLLVAPSLLPPGVYAARARIQTPHLLHVSVSPLALRSFRTDADANANSTGSTIGDPAAAVGGRQTDDTLVLLRMFFDRTLAVHSAPSLESSASLFSLVCSGSIVPLSAWLDGSEPDRPQLVTPADEWMEFFADDEVDEVDEDTDAESSGLSLSLPTGHIGAGGSPFASNSFVALLALPKDTSHRELEQCEIELQMHRIMQQPPTKQHQAKGSKKAPPAAGSPSVSDPKPIVVTVPLAPRSLDAASAKKHVRQRDFSTAWSPAVRTTRWILPAPAVSADPSALLAELNSTASLASTCASLREEQRLIFLENGATSVGAIVGPIVSTMMQPVISQFEQTSTVQTAQGIAKNYLSALTGSIPPEVANFVSESLSTGVTAIVVDLLTTSITDSCSSSIAAALGAYLTRSVSEDVGEIVNQHVLGALTQMIPPDLSQRLTISVTKKLPQQIIKDVTMSLTQTLVGSLTRSMSNFNHMQKMCRQCALYKTRCSDCRYVKDVATAMTSYSGQYAHYYAGYYSEFYAPPASQLDIKGMADQLIADGPAEGTRGVGEDLFGDAAGGGAEARR